MEKIGNGSYPFLPHLFLFLSFSNEGMLTLSSKRPFKVLVVVCRQGFKIRNLIWTFLKLFKLLTSVMLEYRNVFAVFFLTILVLFPMKNTLKKILLWNFHLWSWLEPEIVGQMKAWKMKHFRMVEWGKAFKKTKISSYYNVSIKHKERNW